MRTIATMLTRTWITLIDICGTIDSSISYKEETNTKLNTWCLWNNITNLFLFFYANEICRWAFVQKHDILTREKITSFYGNRINCAYTVESPLKASSPQRLLSFAPANKKSIYNDSCLKPLYNGHFFTRATFFCPQGGRCLAFVESFNCI